MSDRTQMTDLLDYIERYADAIFVRDQIDGKWDAYALSSLPAPRALFHAFRWIREGVIPHRLLTDAEIAEREAEAQRKKGGAQ